MVDLNSRHVIVSCGDAGTGDAVAAMLAAAGATVSVLASGEAGRRYRDWRIPGVFFHHTDDPAPGATAREVENAVAERGPVAICVAGDDTGGPRSATEPARIPAVIGEAMKSMVGLDYGRVIALASGDARAAGQSPLAGLMRELSENRPNGPITFNTLLYGAPLATSRQVAWADDLAAAALWLCDPTSASVDGRAIRISAERD